MMARSSGFGVLIKSVCLVIVVDVYQENLNFNFKYDHYNVRNALRLNLITRALANNYG